MNFDATVTVGNVLTLIAFTVSAMGVLIWYVGSRYFPSKKEMTEYREHVDAQIVLVRTDVETAVKKMENLIDKELRDLNAHAKERYERQCQDFSRVETSIERALADVREARDSSRKADQVSASSKEKLDEHIGRVERMVESLINRQRGTNGVA